MTSGVAVPAVSRALERLGRREDLGREGAGEVLRLIMGGAVGEVQAGAFLMGLRSKGESPEEIVGLAETMRELAEPVEVPGDGDLVDVVGTGGDNLGTFNISTTAAFVVAGAGGRVAKHGNRGATSRSGSADLLEALGIRIDVPPPMVARCIAETGIGFMFAPLHHRAMRHLVPVRRDLGIRTVFNFLGPLTNPAGARRQLTGVSAREYVPVLADALAGMGCEHALVVHGEEGMDELSVAGPSMVVEVRHGKAGRPFEVYPEMFGLERWPPAELRGGDPEDNARIATDVLSGEKGARRDVVVLNAGAALYVSKVADSIQSGVDMAVSSIESGEAREKVRRLRELSTTVATKAAGEV